jgi:hypothetical protein
MLYSKISSVTGKRHRSGVVGTYPSASSFAGARAHHVPVYGPPQGRAEEEEEPAADQLVDDEPQEEQPEQDEAVEEEPTPVKARKPAFRGHSRPQSPFGGDGFVHGGANAVASSVSHGTNAASNSNAAAYRGHFSGVRFGQK